MRLSLAALALLSLPQSSLACANADRMGLPPGLFRDTICAPQHQMADPLWVVQIDRMTENRIADAAEIDGGSIAVVGSSFEDQEPVGWLQTINTAGQITNRGHEGWTLPSQVVWHPDQGIVVRNDRGTVSRLRDGERTDLEFGSSSRRYELAGMDITPEGDLVVLGTEYGPFDPEVNFWTFRPRDKRDAFGEEVDDMWQAFALIDADPEEDRVLMVAREENGTPHIIVVDERGKVAKEKGWISEWDELVTALPDGNGGVWAVTRTAPGGRMDATPSVARVAWWPADFDSPAMPEPQPVSMVPHAAMSLMGDGMLLAGDLTLQQGAMHLTLPVVWAIDNQRVSRGWIPIGQPGQMRIRGLDATTDGRLILWGERFPDGSTSRRSTGFIVAWDGASFIAPMAAGR